VVPVRSHASQELIYRFHEIAESFGVRRSRSYGTALKRAWVRRVEGPKSEGTELFCILRELLVSCLPDLKLSGRHGSYFPN
jgi:hypothetical protein